MAGRKKNKKGAKRSTAANAERRAKNHKTGFSVTHLEVPDGMSFIRLKDDKNQ